MEFFLLKSKRRTNLIETDLFYNITFQNSLKIKNIKHHFRIIYLGAVFAEIFNHTMKDLVEKPVFEKSVGNWIDVLPTTTKQNNNRGHTCTKLTPIKASLKKNEGFVYNNLLD